MTRDDRAKLQLVDAILSFAVFVSIMVLAPFFYRFVDMASNEADPFSSLLLQLTLPLLLISLLLSIGVSARRGV
jgi:hypothetical protein